MPRFYFDVIGLVHIFIFKSSSDLPPARRASGSERSEDPDRKKKNVFVYFFVWIPDQVGNDTSINLTDIHLDQPVVVES